MFIEEKISKVKDQMLMDKILEDMKRFEQEILEKTEIKEPQPHKEKKIIPNKIGQNSQINNKSKLNQKFIKRR